MRQENIYDNAFDAARALIDYILLTMQQDRKEEFNIALSGGKSVAVLYEVWEKEYAQQTDWERIYFYWVDERCVKPTSEESNFRPAYELLIDKIHIKSNHYYRILGEAPPQETVKMYSALVKIRVPENDKGDMSFDFVLLGIGEDGHTSSIFPNNMNLLRSKEPYEIMESPYSGVLRIGMTGKPMLNALHTCFFVIGENKKSIVEEIVKKENEYLYPASYIWNNAANPSIFSSF